MAEKKLIVAITGVAVAIVVLAAVFFVILPENEEKKDNSIFKDKYFVYNVTGTDDNDGETYGGTAKLEVLNITPTQLRVKFTFDLTKGGEPLDIESILPFWIYYTSNGPGGTFVEEKTITGTPWGNVKVKGYEQTVSDADIIIFGGVNDAAPYEIHLNISSGELNGLLIGSLKETNFLS